MTAHAPYHGTSTLSAENRAFLASACAAYRKANGLTLVEAAERAGIDYGSWYGAENNSGARLFGVDSVTARIVSLVLAVSPVCRKGESQHIQPATGASHGTKEEADRRRDSREAAIT